MMKDRLYYHNCTLRFRFAIWSICWKRLILLKYRKTNWITILIFKWFSVVPSLRRKAFYLRKFWSILLSRILKFFEFFKSARSFVRFLIKFSIVDEVCRIAMRFRIDVVCEKRKNNLIFAFARNLIDAERHKLNIIIKSKNHEFDCRMKYSVAAVE